MNKLIKINEDRDYKLGYPVYCDMCDELVKDSYYYDEDCFDDDRVFCESCADKFYRCSVCKLAYLKEEMVVNKENGLQYCKDCYSENYD